MARLRLQKNKDNDTGSSIKDVEDDGKEKSGDDEKKGYWESLLKASREATL